MYALKVVVVIFAILALCSGEADPKKSSKKSEKDKTTGKTPKPATKNDKESNSKTQKRGLYPDPHLGSAYALPGIVPEEVPHYTPGEHLSVAHDLGLYGGVYAQHLDPHTPVVAATYAPAYGFGVGGHHPGAYTTYGHGYLGGFPGGLKGLEALLGGVKIEEGIIRVKTITTHVPVPVPHPVPVEIIKKVPVPVPHPVPVDVPRAVKVEVPQPYPVEVPKPYPVEVPKPVPHPVPHPVEVRVDKPYPVEVPVPYKVEVHKPVPVPVPHHVEVHKPVFYYEPKKTYAPAYAQAPVYKSYAPSYTPSVAYKSYAPAYTPSAAYKSYAPSYTPSVAYKSYAPSYSPAGDYKSYASSYKATPSYAPPVIPYTKNCDDHVTYDHLVAKDIFSVSSPSYGKPSVYAPAPAYHPAPSVSYPKPASYSYNPVEPSYPKVSAPSYGPSYSSHAPGYGKVATSFVGVQSHGGYQSSVHHHSPHY